MGADVAVVLACACDRTFTALHFVRRACPACGCCGGDSVVGSVPGASIHACSGRIGVVLAGRAFIGHGGSRRFNLPIDIVVIKAQFSFPVVCGSSDIPKEHL